MLWKSFHPPGLSSDFFFFFFVPIWDFSKPANKISYGFRLLIVSHRESSTNTAITTVLGNQHYSKKRRKQTVVPTM